MERWVVVKEYDDLSIEPLNEPTDINSAIDLWCREVAVHKVTGDLQQFVAISMYGPMVGKATAPKGNDIPALSWNSLESHEALAWFRLADGTIKHESINIE